MTFFIFLLACAAAASTGVIFKPGAWYESLVKPSFTPPNWLFPVAWTIIYLLLAWAGYRLTLIPGSETHHVNSAGSVRSWKNAPDGTFVAASDNRRYGSAMGTGNATGPGTWSVSEDGRYCVQIEWRRLTEKWCSAIVKGDDGGYYLNSVDPAKRIEFVR